MMPSREGLIRACTRHVSPTDSELQNSNFEATALEHLRAETIQVEAFARVAEAAAGALLAPTSGRQRWVYGRIQSLATKTSQQASASLQFASHQVVAFTSN